VKKVAGNGEFQDGRQNGRRALSASLSKFKLVNALTTKQLGPYNGR